MNMEQNFILSYKKFNSVIWYKFIKNKEKTVHITIKQKNLTKSTVYSK